MSLLPYANGERKRAELMDAAFAGGRPGPAPGTGGTVARALLEQQGLFETVPEVMRRNAEIRGVIRLDATLRE